MYRLLLLSALALTQLAKAQTDSSTIFLQKALDEKVRGRRMEVVKNLEKAYGYNAQNRQVVSELAAAYQSINFYAKARDKYLQAETLGEKSAATYRALTDLSFSLRQWNDAIKYAQALKKADPSVAVNLYLGKAYYEQEDLGKAIQYLELAAKEEPAKAEIPHTLATAYTNMQNFRLAVPHFQKAISLQPENNRWLYELSLVYYGMNDNASALKYMIEAGDKGYRKDNEYLQNLSTAYMNAGRFAEGMDVLKSVLEKRPTDLGLLDLVAEAHYDAGKYDDAINYYNKILSIDEKKSEALYMMGMAYQKKGQVDNGRKLCDKAITMDPSLSSLKTEKKMPGGL